MENEKKQFKKGPTAPSLEGGSFCVRAGADTLKALKTREKGLSAREAAARLQAYGPNALAEEERSDTLVRVIVRQFKGILILILLVAAGVSFLLGDHADGQVILLAVFINIIVGTYQEKKAGNALRALKSAVVTMARVRREGTLIALPQQDLVVGDIVEVQAGDRVPADLRVLAAHALEANEAALTGESHPQEKLSAALSAAPPLAERSNMLMLGTVVTAGRGVGVAVATGKDTEMGAIARLLAETKEERTPLQNQLDRFARHLLLIILAVVALMFFIGLLAGRPLAEMFATSIAVAVSAIPEGLTIALTVILALGMQEILRRKGLVRSLIAAETLGATSVICTDKTGTLTEGQMKVVAIETWSGSHEADALQRGAIPQDVASLCAAAALCNDAAVPGQEGKIAATGNTTDRALMDMLVHVGIDVGALRRAHKRVDEIPFSSATKFMATLHGYTPRPLRGHPSPEGNILYIKGAPETLLAQVTHAMTGRGAVVLSARDRAALTRRVARLSGKGLRVLCLTQKEWTHPGLRPPLSRGDLHIPLLRKGEGVGNLENLTFLGFVGIQDPVRAEAADAIAAAEKAGIATVMITGDHRLTATAIAKNLGLLTQGKEVMDGTELASLKPQEFAQRVKNIAVYARATPEDKLRIIGAWRKKGAVVAMTGDGVNDAPALKAADIGVALGSGTDVAKEASDLVLIENNFSTITAAIRQGRAIFETIRTVTVYLISNSFAEMLAISVSLLCGLPLPFLPAQILWINMVTDSFPALALTREPSAPGIMRERPRARSEPLVTAGHRWVILIVSTGLAAFSLGVFILYWKLFDALALARTMSFTVLSVATLCYIFSLRSMKEPLWRISFFRNPLVIVATATSLLLQIAAVYAPPLQRLFGTVPLMIMDWALIAVIGIAFVAMIEWIKAVFRHAAQER